jgi:probable rRNA maturation factor
MHIIIENNQNTLEFTKNHENLIKIAVMTTAKKVTIPYLYEVYISITDNPSIKALNNEHRNIDKSTDVLSFPMNDIQKGDFSSINESTDLFNDILLLGDIFISFEKVLAQATEYGHSFDRELAFLIIHGLLHLLGFDHMTDEDAKEMFSLQEQILLEMNLTRNNN